MNLTLLHPTESPNSPYENLPLVCYLPDHVLAQGPKVPLNLISELIKLEAKLCSVLWSSRAPLAPASDYLWSTAGQKLLASASLVPAMIAAGEMLKAPFHQSDLKLGS